MCVALTRRKPMDLSLVGGHYDALQHSVAETRRERDDRRERRQREDELRLRWLADVARIPEWHFLARLGRDCCNGYVNN